MSESNDQFNSMPQFAPAGGFADGETTVVFSPLGLESVSTPGEEQTVKAVKATHRRRHLVWPWVLAGVIVLFAACIGGGFAFFQSHALPGVTLWGHSMAGKSEHQIAASIDDAVSNATVPVSYNGTTVDVSLKDLGLSVDSQSIASDVVNSKRDAGWWQRYAFWIKQDVTVEPASPKAADSTTLNEKLSVEEVKPVDASLQLNADQNGFDVVAGQQGEGLDAEPVAQAAVDQVESLNTAKASTVTVSLKSTDPSVTDDIAQKAKATLDGLLKKPVSIKIGDHEIASFDAPALASAMTINANENAKLADSQTRNGYVVFDADKLQQYYDNTIKAGFSDKREDRDVIVNSVGDELQVNQEGHDGVTITGNSDANVGEQAAGLLADGGGSVTVQGTVDPMQTKKTERTVVIDLSDHTVTAYQDGKAIMKMNAGVGRGNDPKTGECSGDLCTPTYCDPNAYDNCTSDGDFKIWLKYESQNMSGNLTLSDGSSEKWDVQNVGFVNYFSKTGCAIHRVASTSAMNNSQLPGGVTSHGCVGIGWDVAQQFYEWCLMGTTVHVQP